MAKGNSMINHLSQLTVGQEVSLAEIKAIVDAHDKENPKAVISYRSNNEIFLGRADGEKDTSIHVKAAGVFPMFVVTAIEEI